MADQTMALTADLMDEAIEWHLRLPRLAGEQWSEFVAWLERSPAHQAAYDSVAEADALAGEGLAGVALAPATRTQPVWHRRPFARYAGAAAAAVLVLGLSWGMWPARGDMQVERTAAGATKQLAFSDGTRIDLNGETALAVDQSAPRRMRLDEGEARFSVRHGEKPFTVEAGGFVLRDLGTVFNVQLTPRTLQVDVSEGSVLFDPDGAHLTLGAGDRVTVDRAHNLVVKRAGAASGDWLTGELAFADAGLDEVVAAIHRRYGTDIVLGDGLAGRAFTGNIRLSGKADEDVAHLAGLIGAQYHREAGKWVISGADGTRR